MFKRYLFSTAVPYLFLAPDRGDGQGGPNDIDQIVNDLEQGDQGDDDNQDDNQDDDQDGDNQDADEDGGDGAADDDAGGGAANSGNQGGRANNRIRALNEDRETARRERDTLQETLVQTQRQLQELARLQGGNPAAADRLVEQARLDAMDPLQRIEHRLEQSQRELQASIQRTQFESRDMVDKTEFQSLARTNPVVARYNDKVEKALSDMRAGGHTAPRKAVLAYLIGNEALAKIEKGVSKGKDAGQRRASAARSQPARQDTGAGWRQNSGGDSLDAIGKRLAGVKI